MLTTLVQTPYGTAIATYDQRGLRSLQPTDNYPASIDHDISLQQAFDNYIDGNDDAFDKISISVEGFTPFQQSILQALQTVPYGETITYGQLAAVAGHPRAVRATASTVARNPLWVIIPCHRVLPASGGTGKYAYGSRMKADLLSHEAGQ